MNFKVLVTDNLFIFKEHEVALNKAGIKIERLDKPEASENELIKALHDKDGYILGGIEKVTENVIKSTNKLKAICFTGNSWDHFIPGYKTANEKGIKITIAPHTNARAVAEWVFATSLSMHRDLFSLGRTGDQEFKTVGGFNQLKVGVVGLGHIGTNVANLFDSIGCKVVYFSRSHKVSNYERVNLDDLLKTCDIICFAVSSEAGKNFLDKSKLAKLKSGAIVTCMTVACTDEAALLAELKSGRIRAFLDWTPENPEFKKLSLSSFYCSNSHGTACNTFEANKRASDITTQSMINILSGKSDEYIVN